MKQVSKLIFSSPITLREEINLRRSRSIFGDTREIKVSPDRKLVLIYAVAKKNT